MDKRKADSIIPAKTHLFRGYNKKLTDETTQYTNHDLAHGEKDPKKGCESFMTVIYPCITLQTFSVHSHIPVG